MRNKRITVFTSVHVLWKLYLKNKICVFKWNIHLQCPQGCRKLPRWYKRLTNACFLAVGPKGLRRQSLNYIASFNLHLWIEMESETLLTKLNWCIIGYRRSHVYVYTYNVTHDITLPSLSDSLLYLNNIRLNVKRSK